MFVDTFDTEEALNETIIVVEISAPTYFGARHAIESLSQFWGYDDGFDGIQAPRFIILENVTITDGPQFPHRGLLIDTSRNFISKVHSLIES